VRWYFSEGRRWPRLECGSRGGRWIISRPAPDNETTVSLFRGRGGAKYKPVDTNRARLWLRTAEKLAGLPPQEQGCWHPYRRGFATARKHLGLTDLAAAGGWKGTETLTLCYLHPDADTMLRVVMGGAELREVRQA
jgi:hypothetical protein